jgi:hypothetical protein
MKKHRMIGTPHFWGEGVRDSLEMEALSVVGLVPFSIGEMLIASFPAGLPPRFTLYLLRAKIGVKMVASAIGPKLFNRLMHKT